MVNIYNQNILLKRHCGAWVLMLALFCAVFFICGFATQALAAKSAQTLYQEADDYYKKLKADKKLYQYRSNWETGIAKFMAVYKNYKSDNRAPAALYRSGIMYLELYNYSKKISDKSSGINTLKQVIKEYPGTTPANQAEDVLRKNGVTDIPSAIKVLGPSKEKPGNAENIRIAGVSGSSSGSSSNMREPLENFAATQPVAVTENTATSTAAQTATSKSTDAATKARELYMAGEKAYTGLLKDRNLRLKRHNWENCLNAFEQAYQADRKGPWAAASLYAKAMVYKDLYHYFGSSDYVMESKKALQLIVRDYPNSAYADKARQLDTQNGFQSFAGPSLITGLPNPDSPLEPTTVATTTNTNTGGNTAQANNTKPATTVQNVAANQILASSQTTGNKATLSTGQPVTVTPTVQSSGKVTVTEVRHWSNPQYTRVVIGLSGPTVYKYHLLLEDRAKKLPPRLYVDVEKSELGSDVNRTQPINDDLLLSARAGQYTTEDVRVVLDLKSFGSYKIFPLNDPFRIVIDIWADKNGAEQTGYLTSNTTTTPSGANLGSTVPAGSSDGNSGVEVKTPQTYTPSNNVAATDNSNVTVIVPPKEGAIGTTDLAKQLGLGVKRIVVDPGHGGKDGGAPGAAKGVLEKIVVLQISLKLRDKIQKELGCEVILTRSTDVYLSLEERMAIANSKNADLFISIHTNAARNKEAYGIETYFLNLATDEESIRVAAMENATSTRGISDLQNILNDLMQNSKINESSRLATLVQKSMVTELKKTYGNIIKDKGVKQAPFYVLLGATMPSILVETGFLSNPAECKRLTDSKYQDQICNAIVTGVKTYIRELKQ